MSIELERMIKETRRRFLLRTGAGLGSIALSSLLSPRRASAGRGPLPGFPNFPAKVKRVVFLLQSGGPSQLELFDYKPKLQALDGTELPDSVRMGQTLTTMTSGQDSLPVVAPRFTFAQYGQSGAWVSELLPNTAKIVDDLCIIRSVFTDAINHDPAITMLETGSVLPGRPSFGSWVSYGLGSLTDNLPTFVVMISKNTQPLAQPLYSRLWSSAFLPSDHQGVQLRAAQDPVLYLNDPTGLQGPTAQRFASALKQLDQQHFAATNDPEINTRIEAYELAYKMQIAVPQVTDLSNEPASTFALYGDDAKVPGTHAANCLLARRLLEKGVRFVQLYHRDWDHHANLPDNIRRTAKEDDQASAALVTDLKNRGLLDDTLVIWGGEFGRTVYSQGKVDKGNYGRDHHPRCFSMWITGGGVKRGLVYGASDDYGYNIVDGPVHVHDVQATALQLLGIDHTKLTYHYTGRDFRLTDVGGTIVDGILA
jgi:hypothetical protein